MFFLNSSILYYRVFDIGDEVNLNVADDILKRTTLPIRLVLSKKQRALIINEPPLVLSLGQWQYEVDGRLYPVTTFGKLWPFGAFSVMFRFQLPSPISLDDMRAIASQIDQDSSLHQLAVAKTREILESCANAVKNPTLSELYEDYIIFHIEKPIEALDPEKLLKLDNFYSMILLDSSTTPSSQVKEELAREVYQYAKDDFVLVDWNSAFLVDQTGTPDIPDVIEFALCQMLEMQYYDNVLTKRLGLLYRSLGEARPGIFNNRYAGLWRQAAITYLETSEIIEMVENSFKVVGDFYYAQIFRVASSKFRFTDWRQNIDGKLKNIAEISKLISSDINEKRGQLLEIIIIILIAIEAIPPLISLFSGKF